ncbi:MAG: CPBP family intramembrane metalloprotease [Thermaerobacter sp.]|nr:CPBP family intramembrane metalloprotease [Thermaerobacter sp.]
MLVLYSLLLILFWLLVPTLLATLIRPPRPLGRDGFAALIAIAFWVLIALLHLPIHLAPHPMRSHWILVLLLLSLASYVYLFVRGLRMPPNGYRPAGLRGDFLSMAVLSPLDEELLFRGLLFALALPALGPFFTIVYTSILFLLAHEAGRLGGLRRSRQESLADLVFGLLAGALYAWTGTIAAPVLAHVLVNAWYAYTRSIDEVRR